MLICNGMTLIDTEDLEAGEEIVKTAEEGDANLDEIEDEVLMSDEPVAP